ncbi:MAG: hypothetical protein IKO05_12140 [Selenomonadaceae bacterium]|nr:hypothetical protein [Selenomonadaceae bacterium]
MNKEEIYQRVLDCRLIADEVCVATLLVPNAEERFELNRHAKKILDEIDFFLNCLHQMGVDAE